MKEKETSPFKGFVREDALIPQRTIDREAEERAVDIYAKQMMSIMEV